MIDMIMDLLWIPHFSWFWFILGVVIFGTGGLCGLVKYLKGRTK